MRHSSIWFSQRDAVFDELYINGPLLAVGRGTLRRPFRLSSFHARTVHPNAPAQQINRADKLQESISLNVSVKNDAVLSLASSFLLMGDETEAVGPPGTLLRPMPCHAAHTKRT
jgi:hypothetical protein